MTKKPLRFRSASASLETVRRLRSKPTPDIKIEQFAVERFTDLMDELNAWRDARGIKDRPDAYKLLKGKLSPDDRDWLRDFVKRWEDRCVGDV